MGLEEHHELFVGGTEQEVGAAAREYNRALNKFSSAQASASLEAIIKQLEQQVATNQRILNTAKRREAQVFENYDKAKKAFQDAELLKNSRKKYQLSKAKNFKQSMKYSLDAFKKSCTHLVLLRNSWLQLLRIAKSPENRADWDAYIGKSKIVKSLKEVHEFLKDRKKEGSFRPKRLPPTFTRFHTM